MNDYLKTCLIVCPLIFTAGFVDSVAGGGGIIAIPAYLLAGLPAHLAAGTNKIVSGSGAVFSSAKYIRSGKVQIRPVLFAAIGAIAGAAAGTALAARLPESLLKLLLLLALPVVAVFLAVKRDFGAERAPDKAQANPLPGKTRDFVSLAIGLILGCYDGLIGPGTGTFMIMCFTAFLAMDLVTAAGCARVTNLASNIAAAAVWIVNGHVMWSLVLPAAVCSIAGNYFGARFAIRGGTKRVRAMMFVVLGLLFIKIVYDFAGKM